ncbi:MAG: hypothetical protein MZW92_78440 [Comamonadaceae bacterium]|nr:hypothetical protein [Comamonadaceae bacterium]
MKHWSSLLILAAFAALTVAAWAFANQPTPEPPWPSRIQGFSFQPYQKHQDAIEQGEDPAHAAGRCRPEAAGRQDQLRPHLQLRSARWARSRRSPASTGSRSPLGSVARHRSRAQPARGRTCDRTRARATPTASSPAS